jgi:hypothetical protein
MTAGDIINAALLIVAIAGIGLTWGQLRSGARTQRAAFLRDLYTTLNNDQAICDGFYAIEYGRFHYSGEFHDTKVEREVDRLLSFFDLVCELYHRKILTKEELQFFEYRFQRVSADPEVAAYLRFLAGFYRDNGIAATPFPSFTRYIGGALVTYGSPRANPPARS